jgi:hypothetical protein
VSKDTVNRKFAEIMQFNYFPQPDNGGSPPPPVDLPPRRRRRPDPKKSLTNFIVVLAAMLGVMLLAYGYGSNTGFTFNKSERPAVECADAPDGGVICRRPDAN